MVASFVVGALVGGFIGHFGDALAGLAVEKWWSQSPTIKIDFQAQQMCPSGKLTDIRRMLDDDRLPLTNGADRLTICDTEALVTIRSQIPRDLAAKYSGCLRWIDGELVMLRASDAVCALPNDAGFICDGAKGRIFPGVGAMGIGESVAACRVDLMRQFGFAS